MNMLRTIRAFSTELQKIASSQYPKDPEILRLLAERKGEEYMEGGRLLSNAMMEGNEYAAKMANMARMTRPTGGFSSGSGSNSVLESKTKKHNHYQTARDYAGTAVKGGLTGLGILGAANAMRGHFKAPEGAAAIARATRAARHAATAGATVAIADRAYRHDDIPKVAFVVSPNANSTFRSPAASLAETRATGGFKSSVIHDTGKAISKPFQMGQKFRLPGA